MRHYVPNYLINNIHPITITVVGCGGNGTQALHDLAKINSSLIALGGLGLDVTVYDNDIVESPNVGRQKFSNVDIGENKASVIVTRLNRFYGTSWRSINERFDKDNWLGSNIIISCVDNTKSRRDIQDCFKNRSQGIDTFRKYYWLDFGNGKDFGQFVLGSTNIEEHSDKENVLSKLKTVIDMFPKMGENENIDTPSCSTREALMKQNLFINSVLVTTGMNLLWKLLKDYYIEYSGGYVNLETMTTKPIKIK